MSALPINPWTRTCAECDEARLVKVDLVLNEDETEYDEVPVFLEDTGVPDDLRRAKEISALHFAKKVIKHTATEVEAISYQVLQEDLKN